MPAWVAAAQQRALAHWHSSQPQAQRLEARPVAPAFNLKFNIKLAADSDSEFAGAPGPQWAVPARVASHGTVARAPYCIRRRSSPLNRGRWLRWQVP